MTDPIETFAANLAHHIRNREVLVMGGGRFEPAEIKPVLAALKAGPAMLAALKATSALLDNDPNRARDGWMADVRRDVSAAIAAAEGASVAPAPDPRDAIIADLVAALEDVKERWCPDIGLVDPWLVEKIAAAVASAAGNQVDSPADAEIAKMLTISTAHIMPATARNLDHKADGAPFDLPVTFSKREYGWFIHVPALADVEPGREDHWPAELQDCIAKARALGCDWLCIDRDGDELDGLPVYSWGA